MCYGGDDVVKLIDVEQLDVNSVERLFNLNERTSRVLVFTYPLVQNGPLGPVCRVPFHGRVVAVSAYCLSAGPKDTVIDVQVCGETEFKSTQVWTSILNQRLMINAGTLVDNGQSEVNANNNVVSGDFVRVNFVETGDDPTPTSANKITNATINVVVETF